MFAWSYKELAKIFPKIAQHRIELEIIIPPSHQAKKYQMNFKYVVVLKYDLDKLLAVRCITQVEEATWLSSIVVVPKKKCQVWIYMNFHKLNVATKKDPYPLPFTKKVLDMVVGHIMYFFWMAF
jgi:hypothetical protein